MKEENYPTGAFVAFVLLSQNEWDIKKLINDCKADWNIEIPYDGNEEALVAVMGDVTLAVAIMPAPVPNQEAEHYAGANYMWKDAVEVTKSHKAHLMVSVLGKDANPLERGKLFTKVVPIYWNEGNYLQKSFLHALNKKEPLLSILMELCSIPSFIVMLHL